MPTPDDYQDFRAEAVAYLAKKKKLFGTPDPEDFPNASSMSLAWHGYARTLLEKATAYLKEIDERSSPPTFDPDMRKLANAAADSAHLAYEYFEKADGLLRLTIEGREHYMHDLTVFGSPKQGSNYMLFDGKEISVLRVTYADIFECLPIHAMRPSRKAAVAAGQQPK